MEIMKINFYNLHNKKKSLSLIIHLLIIRLRVFFYKLFGRINPNILNIDILIFEEKTFINKDFYQKIFSETVNLEDISSLVFYNDTITLHPFFEESTIHRPEYSPLLLEEINYLGEVLICLNCEFDLNSPESIHRNLIENRNLILKKINSQSVTFKDHDFLNKSYIEKNRDFYKLINDKIDVEILRKGISIIVPTTFNNFKSTNNSVLDLIGDLYQILMLNKLISNSEILVIYGSEYNKERFDLFNFNLKNSFPDLNIKLVYDEFEFNFSRRINKGILLAKFDNVLCTNDDIKINLNFDISTFLYYFNRKNVASISTILCDSNGVVNHAGISINKNLADEYLKGTLIDELNPGLHFPREVDANSFAFIFTTKNVLSQVGLLDEFFPIDFNDVEWGLRANDLGFTHLVLPYMGINHEISSTRINTSSGPEVCKIVLQSYEIDNLISKHEWNMPSCCFDELIKQK
jgi:hypothetical protein